MKNFLIVFLASYSAWIIGAFLILYFIFGERRKNFLIVLESLSAAILSRFGFTEIIRYFYDSPRPFEALRGVKLLIERDPGGSFPSGHAAFFFAIAATFYLYNKKLGWILFACAIVMGIARVWAYLHWPIDIVGGAAVGIISSLIVNFFFEKYKKKRIEIS